VQQALCVGAIEFLLTGQTREREERREERERKKERSGRMKETYFSNIDTK
jgi:hypothetical protein